MTTLQIVALCVFVPLIAYSFYNRELRRYMFKPDYSSMDILTFAICYSILTSIVGKSFADASGARIAVGFTTAIVASFALSYVTVKFKMKWWDVRRTRSN